MNSIKNVPPDTTVCHVANLPTPFPIRIPFGFFERGKCGNSASHTSRLVRSDFRIERLRNNFKRKKLLEEIRSGFRILSAMSPYRKLRLRKIDTRRLLCRNLYFILRG